MPKLFKQDKSEIFNLWQSYQVGIQELSQHCDINTASINFLLTLINRHDLTIYIV